MIYIKKILILFGGNSYEHEVSCNSVNYLIKNIDKKKYNFELVGIDYDNKWYKIDNNSEIKLKWPRKNKITNIINYLKEFDVVFPMIHGNNGEDGKLQSIFELNSINYIGCNSYTSIVCYDKLLTKLILEKYHIKQIPYYIYHKELNLKELEYPVIIKPCKCGSSIGISRANNYKEAKNGINNALKYDQNIIIEKYIEHKEEYECAILQNKKRIIISNVGQILNNGNIYDYKDKYKNKIDTKIADLNTKIKNNLKKNAKNIFKKLNCKDLSRIDFIYDKDTDIYYFNEINTMPGFTEISMYPKLIKEIGINSKKLITILIENNKKIWH